VRAVEETMSVGVSEDRGSTGVAEVEYSFFVPGISFETLGAFWCAAGAFFNICSQVSNCRSRARLSNRRSPLQIWTHSTHNISSQGSFFANMGPKVLIRANGLRGSRRGDIFGSEAPYQCWVQWRSKRGMSWQGTKRGWSNEYCAQ